MAKAPNTRNFTLEDKLALSKLLVAYAPLGNDEWETVSQLFHARREYRGPPRTIPSLKNKWRNMRNTKKPTGKANPSSLASLVLKADEAITVKSCTEEIGASDTSDIETEDEEDDTEEGHPFNGNRFGDMQENAEDAPTPASINAAAAEAALFLAGPSSSHRRVSPAIPQPRGTKNSSQLNRFNETFERFADKICQNLGEGSSSSAGESNAVISRRLDKMDENISKFGDLLGMVLAKMSQGPNENNVVVNETDENDASGGGSDNNKGKAPARD